MTVMIKKGSAIIAKRTDGIFEAKVAGKNKIYPGPIELRDGMYVFHVKPGGLYEEMHVPEAGVEVTPDIAIPDGTYTIVDGDSYVTVKIRLSKDELNENGEKNFFLGKQIVSYLSGPDNVNNFTAFGHIDENGGIRIWKRFRDETAEKYQKALVVLQTQGLEAQRDAGEAYALRSKRCWRCNLTLSVPASLHRGLGDICAKKLGVA